MNQVLRHAEAALRRHPAPALHLQELLGLVRASSDERTLDAPLLRTLLEAHPERFRLLDPWQGPWRLSGVGADPGERSGDPWVVMVTDPGDQDLAGPRPAARLRESVRWIARGVDPRARRDLIRWHTLVLAERGAREILARRAA